MFLHSKGYTFFNEGKLTFKEVIALVEEENENIRRKEQAIKKQKRLNKRRR